MDVTTQHKSHTICRGDRNKVLAVAVKVKSVTMVLALTTNPSNVYLAELKFTAGPWPSSVPNCQPWNLESLHFLTLHPEDHFCLCTEMPRRSAGSDYDQRWWYISCAMHDDASSMCINLALASIALARHTVLPD